MLTKSIKNLIAHLPLTSMKVSILVSHDVNSILFEYEIELFIKFQILLATLAAVANASSIYGLGSLGQPIIRTGYSAPISALNAYPGAINAYAGAAIGAPLAYAGAHIAAPLAAAPLAAPIVNAAGPVSSQSHQQVQFTI